MNTMGPGPSDELNPSSETQPSASQDAPPQAGNEAAVNEPPFRTDGIRFYQSGDKSVRFSEPMEFPRATSGGFLLPPIPGCGLYAILVRDESASPRPFRVLYFAESDNIDASARETHERFGDWCAAANGAENLYVAYCWRFGSTKEEREAIAAALIDNYSPQCNAPFKSMAQAG